MSLQLVKTYFSGRSRKAHLWIVVEKYSESLSWHCGQNMPKCLLAKQVYISNCAHAIRCFREKHQNTLTEEWYQCQVSSMRQERGQPGTKCLWSHRRSFWRDQTCELTHAEAMHKPDVLARSWFCQENLQETMQSPLKIVGGLSASINEAVKWVVMCRVGQHLALTRWVGLWAPQGKSSSRGIAKDGKEGKSEWLIGCWLLEMYRNVHRAQKEPTTKTVPTHPRRWNKPGVYGFKVDVTQSHISPKPDNELREKEYAEKILHDDENRICSEKHILTNTTWKPQESQKIGKIRTNWV